jgi:nucleoside phosphorylase
MTILVVMAMRAEAAPIVESMQLAPRADAPSPNAWFEGEGVAIVVNGVDLVHGVDSIGTTAAALATATAIERFSPSIVVSAGTAGGFTSRGGHIGQVILADGPIIHHDRRVPLQGFAEYALGRHPTKDVRSIAGRLGFSSGPCSTGDSLDAPALDMEAMDAHGTLAKDMEAAAVAGVAARAGTPFTALKVITDLVDSPEPTVEQFTANLTQASATLADALPRFLAALYG